MSRPSWSASATSCARSTSSSSTPGPAPPTASPITSRPGAAAGVRRTGTDGWSWDAPFVHTKEKYAESGDAGLIWEGHKAGREIGYCHLEKLHNLEALPPHGFTLSCFPVKIRGASAGWTRAVAILDE